MKEDTPLRGLKNIGAVIADRLESVGVITTGDLRARGVARVYNQLRVAYRADSLPVCYYLYSLQGALEGCHWNDLDERVKQALCQAAGVVMPLKRKGNKRKGLSKGNKAADS